MRITILIILICSASFSVICQSSNNSQQIEEVQTAVGKLVGKGQRAVIMLRDLTELQGSVVALMEDSFNLKIKGSKGKRIVATIAYQDVLVISSKNVSISLIPDPSSRSYGSWNDVLKIFYNHSLEVILENGQIMNGRTGDMTKDKLTLINDNDNQKYVLSRDQILYVYRVRRESGKSGDGLVKGANKGKKVGEVVGITPAGKIFSSGLGAAIGAGIGAIFGASRKKEKLRVLIYSK